MLDNKEKFTFGKYKGKTIQTVLIIDKQYLLWLSGTGGIYNISSEWRNYIMELYEKEKQTTYCTYLKR